MITYQSLKIFILCICTSFVYQANAQIYVDLTATTGANDGTSWINAYTDFQDALDNAVANDTIWLAAGTYIPTEEPDGAPTGVGNERYRAFHLANKDLSIYGGFSGTETMLNQRNWQANITTLSGDFNNDDVVSGSGSTLSFINNSENAYHTLITIGLGTTAEINGFQVSGGNADDSGDFLYAGETVTLYEGAGLYNKLNSSPHLSNMIISTNFSIGAGGGMYNNASSPTFVNVSFSFNQGQLGAGMYNYTSSAVLSDVTFIGNNATFNGGGMNNDFNSTPSLLNVTFSDNNAQNGGGLVCYSNSAASLTNVSFINNSASQTGGGIFNNQSSPTLSNVVFSENVSTFGGGMINNHSSPILMNVVFSANSAQNGGGMYNLQTTSLPSLTNVTFSANNAFVQGGGMFNSNGTPTLSNTVFYGNIAPSSKDLHNMFGSTVVEYCAFEDYIYGAALGCFSLTSSPFTNAADPDGIDDLWMTNDDGLTLAIGSPCFATGTSAGAPIRDVLGVIRPTPPSIGAYDEPCIPIFGTDFQTACDSLTWLDGNTYTTSTNSPTFSILLFDGCDSLVTLDLTVNYSSAPSTILANTCDSSSVNSVTDTLMNTVGCDSIVTTNTILTPTATESQSLTACDSALVNGSWYFSSQNVVDSNTTTTLCDSIHTVFLTIKQSTISVDIQTACDSLTWIDGITYFSSTSTTTFTTTNAVNCDSVVTLILTVNYSSSGTHTDTACSSYTWIDGNTYNASTNTPTFTLTNEYNCDSTVTLDLTVNNPSAFNDMRTACDSMTWINGVTYYSSTNIPTVTLTNAVGCDSVITLDLDIFYTNIIPDVRTACDSLTWIDGNTYTTSNNTAALTLTNALGCDSIVALDLTINNSNNGIDVIAACDSITWINGITYTSANNTATTTLANNAGCDSIVTLNFSIIPPSTSGDTHVTCGPFTWINGITYNNSNNTAAVTLSGTNTCDSIVTLDLTVNSPNASTDILTACDSYTWIDGITYSSSNNTVIATLTNAAGCDSIVSLDLTINYSVSSIDTHTACDQFTWINGNTYLSSNNTASVTFAGGAANGCDSTVVLDLTLGASQGHTYVLTKCDSYTWVNGVSYTSSIIGDSYVVPGAAANGCDSLYFLDLTIIPSGSGIDVVSACKSYTWIDGITYTSSTNTPTYTLSGTNPNGCDLAMSLDLTIQTVPSISITLSNGVLSAAAGLGNYQWYRNGQLIPGANGGDYTPNNWGLYTCSTSNGLCSGSSNGILISITSIKDPTFDFLGIYPNPVNDAMRIDVANEKLTSIMLVDITGKVIATLDAQSREFSMAEYARGMYFIELMNQDKRSILKIILK